MIGGLRYPSIYLYFVYFLYSLSNVKPQEFLKYFHIIVHYVS